VSFNESQIGCLVWTSHSAASSDLARRTEACDFSWWQRLSCPSAGAKWFEVDRADVLAAKRAAMTAAGAAYSPDGEHPAPSSILSCCNQSLDCCLSGIDRDAIAVGKVIGDWCMCMTSQQRPRQQVEHQSSRCGRKAMHLWRRI